MEKKANFYQNKDQLNEESVKISSGPPSFNIQSLQKEYYIKNQKKLELQLEIANLKDTIVFYTKKAEELNMKLCDIQHNVSTTNLSLQSFELKMARSQQLFQEKPSKEHLKDKACQPDLKDLETKVEKLQEDVQNNDKIIESLMNSLE